MKFSIKNFLSMDGNYIYNIYMEICELYILLFIYILNNLYYNIYLYTIIICVYIHNIFN